MIRAGPRWGLWLAVFGGAGVVIVLVLGFLSFTARPLKPPTQTRVVIAGCDGANFVDYSGGAGTGLQALAPFGLMCQVHADSSTAPTCEEIMSKYIAAHGTLTKDVAVFVFRGTDLVCQEAFSGEGQPK